MLSILRDEPQKVIGILSTALGAVGCWVWGSKLVLLRRINRDLKALQEDNEPAVLDSQKWLVGRLRNQKARCESPDELAELEARLRREEAWLLEHRDSKSRATSTRRLWSRTEARAIWLYLGTSLGLLVIGAVICLLTYF